MNIFEVESVVVETPRKFPQEYDTYSLGFFSSLEKAEERIKFDIAENAFNDEMFSDKSLPKQMRDELGQEKVLFYNVYEHTLDLEEYDPAAEYVYLADGTFYGKEINHITPETTVEEAPFKFNVGDIVEFDYNEKMRLGIVAALPEAIDSDEIDEFEEDDEDFIRSSGSYYRLLSAKGKEYYAQEMKVFKPTIKLNEEIKEKLLNILNEKAL